MESDRTSEVILDIGKKNSLPIDKIGKLSYTTFLMMTGALPARAYISELERALGIPNEKAAGIAREINTRLFAPIREELKRVHGTPTHEPLVPESSPAPLPRKPAGEIPRPSEPKPISIPIQRETPSIKPQSLPTKPAEAVKTAPPSQALTGSPVTVPFKSLIEKKGGLVEAPVFQKAENVAQIPAIQGPSSKKEANATVITSNTPLSAPQVPVKSVKIEKPSERASTPPPAKPKEAEKKNIHEEVHRLLKEHFESTSAVSPTPKPAIPAPLKTSSVKETVTVSVQPPKPAPMATPREIPVETPKSPVATYQSKDPYREAVED